LGSGAIGKPTIATRPVLAVTNTGRGFAAQKGSKSMHPDEQRSAWEDGAEAILPIAGALAALSIMLMILVA